MTRADVDVTEKDRAAVRSFCAATRMLMEPWEREILEQAFATQRAEGIAQERERSKGLDAARKMVALVEHERDCEACPYDGEKCGEWTKLSQAAYEAAIAAIRPPEGDEHA